MRTDKIYLRWIIGASFLLLSFGGSSQQLTPLDEYVKTASENNPELKSLFYEYLSAIEKAPQARTLPDPTVMFNVMASPVETRLGAQRAGISINQAFPWFGQLKAQESIVVELAKVRFEVFEEKKNQIAFDVQSVYFRIYLLEATTKITRENIILLQSLKELANINLQGGKGSAVDLLRIEMELEELNNQLIYLQDSREVLVSEFNEKLNVIGLSEIDLPDSLQPLLIESEKQILLDSLYQNNPSLRRYDKELDMIDGELNLAEKMGLPSFSLGLTYINIAERTDVTMPDNGRDALILPQVGVRIPIFRNKYESMVKEQQLLKDAKNEGKNNQTNLLTTSLEKGWRDYRDAVRRIALYQKLSGLASQSIDILFSQYSSGGADFEEILRMDRKLLRYKLETVKAVVDQNTSAAYINYLIGKKI